MRSRSVSVTIIFSVIVGISVAYVHFPHHQPNALETDRIDFRACSDSRRGERCEEIPQRAVNRCFVRPGCILGRCNRGNGMTCRHRPTATPHPTPFCMKATLRGTKIVCVQERDEREMETPSPEATGESEPVMLRGISINLEGAVNRTSFELCLKRERKLWKYCEGPYEKVRKRMADALVNCCTNVTGILRPSLKGIVCAGDHVPMHDERPPLPIETGTCVPWVTPNSRSISVQCLCRKATSKNPNRGLKIISADFAVFGGRIYSCLQKCLQAEANNVCVDGNGKSPETLKEEVETQFFPKCCEGCRGKYRGKGVCTNAQKIDLEALVMPSADPDGFFETYEPDEDGLDQDDKFC